MSRFKNTIDQQKSHINTLRGGIVGIAIVAGAFFYGWKTAPDNLTVNVPPDLRSGSTRLWWDVPPESVYGFGLYVYQQLNRWPNDGNIDYEKNIERMRHLLTASCRAELQDDVKKRRTAGELRDRVRGIYELIGRGFIDNPEYRVIQDSRNSWIVNLDLNADEYFLNEPVKRSASRYPLRVLRHDVDPKQNPYGLALDCFAGQIQRLEIEGEGAL